jgi:CHAD domain-containing protein
MTAVSDHVEREVKLVMPIGADLPDLREIVTASVRQPEEDLRAVYFDTSDLRLWERGITLRHRLGERTPKWTLKLPRPSSGDELVRAELEWAGDEEHLPEQAVDALSGIVRRAPLHKVAELHTQRIRFLLEEDGVVWAELASDVVTVVEGLTDGPRFRQLELEFTSGGSGWDDEARAVVRALRQAGAHPDPHPKVERVLGPRTGDRALGPKSSAEEVVVHAISSGLGRLLDHDCRIRVAGRQVEPEDVHQARVATRRLRSDLGTLEPLIDPIWVDHVRADLRSVGGALGAVRDIDVLTKRLCEAGAADRLTQMLRQERASAVEALHQVLHQRFYFDLLDRLHAASARPPIADRRLAGRKARRVLPALVDRRRRRLRREVHAAGRCPGDDHLHQIRKRSKQLRYASELAIPVKGKPARRTAKQSESLQTLLGEHHDAVVATQWLKQAGNRMGIDASHDVAFLIGQQRKRRQQIEHRWRARYKPLTKRRDRSWLAGAR